MLVGKKTLLRPLHAADVEVYHRLDADIRQVGAFWPISMKSERSVKDRFEKSGYWSDEYSVLLMTDHADKPLGYVAFYPGALYQHTREIGYRLFKTDDHGNGYATEAVSLTVAYLFASKPIERIQAAVVVGNIGSRRVLEKVGFKKEGLLRSVVFLNGRHHDMELFSILRSEATSLDQVLAPLPDARARIAASS
ncbi:GNAT family N-acetyltransferase [Candidatus Bipolaricaulota bacterium]|nr:GNAT family N-acetyltransferase [Candidatus Bipolaricaulota bacterium]